MRSGSVALWRGAILAAGGGSNHWSRSAELYDEYDYDESNAYVLYLFGLTVDPSEVDDRTYGYSLRCLQE